MDRHCGPGGHDRAGPIDPEWARIPDRIDESDEPRAVPDENLEPNLVDELTNAVHHRVDADRLEPGGTHVLVAVAAPRRFEHRIADERDRLRRVERKAGRAMTPGQLGG